MKILIADFHVGTLLWQKAILEKIGVIVDAQSLSGHHRYLKEGAASNVVVREVSKLYGCINGCWDDKKTAIIKKNFDNEIKKMDHNIVLSSFPPAGFEPFVALRNMKIIMNAGHRFHLGRYPEKNCREFIDKLKKMSNNGDIVAAMSKYDYEYIKHYTGITPVPLYVSCFHLSNENHYKPTSDIILVGPAHVEKIPMFKSIDEMNMFARIWGKKNRKNIVKFAFMKSLYSNYKYEDLGKLLGKHKAIVIFPYSVFSISMIEIYESNIPVFVPSVDILIKNKSMYDRVMFPIYCKEEDMKKIDKPDITSPHKFSPNSYDEKAQRYWLQFCYFYQQKNVVVWNSMDDLLTKLNSLDLADINKKMYLENMENRQVQLENWKRVLRICGK